MAKTKRIIGRRSPYCFQYAAKFVCIKNNLKTSISTQSLLNGDYKTLINVHNPSDHDVKFRFKVALGGKDFISKFKSSLIEPDALQRFSCREIGKFKFPGGNPIHGVSEGFFVIESTDSLDVVAVYTAGPLGGDVASIEVEDVRERQIHRVEY